MIKNSHLKLGKVGNCTSHLVEWEMNWDGEASALRLNNGMGEVVSTSDARDLIPFSYTVYKLS